MIHAVSSPAVSDLQEGIVSQNAQVMLGIFGGSIGVLGSICYLPVGWNIVGPIVVGGLAVRLITHPIQFRSR